MLHSNTKRACFILSTEEETGAREAKNISKLAIAPNPPDSSQLHNTSLKFWWDQYNWALNVPGTEHCGLNTHPVNIFVPEDCGYKGL